MISENTLNDKIRGCLMAGAAGDALGYEVEFINRKTILSHYGERGIREFKLDSNRKALISDDTQMTLFTANGMLMGLTRGYMRGIGGRPEDYVEYAYMDWYYTQTRKPKDYYPHTWLYRLPEMAHRRAPGITCLNALESLVNHQEVKNNSKGCGGIMRVAPMALLDAGYKLRNQHSGYSLTELATAGCQVAECTHKHPLGFLPAALLTTLLHKVLFLTPDQVKEDIDHIVESCIRILGRIYKEEKYAPYKKALRELSRKALRLANSDTPDAEAISMLGEGWTADDAWAIALFCAVRHIDSVEMAIIAAVNHDGDSDSTGSITGNIMGAIYGYEHIKQRNIFCSAGCELEQTLELSEIILALADDLTTGCIISEYDSDITPAKIQWYARYCDMLPVGIGGRDLESFR
ncbi:MAG: ADP-ribosylglycohydrolase family protein [Tidjanibacter sp.]|nr:ADP-ribosylglycohydrolase family protein [Tidjanibacter sp.]